MTERARYWAFLSYSHQDEQWARWLQQALERYRVPERLRKRPGGQMLPKRLFPIFRDRDELASATSLSQSIERALADSDALIVICSPAAAASRWVNEEIRRFQAEGRADRIFCLLVAGRPTAGAEDSAFPPALVETAQGEAAREPLAADVTLGGDGKRNALLKLVAGLLRVGIDDLKHRDAQRRARFWSSVAAGSIAMSALTIGLAVTAYLAQQEADLRRGQAEGLIAFMLGDLRGRLEPIGKLDVLDAVGDQAMRYFAVLGDRGSDQEILSRAKALRQIGEVRFSQGHLEPALAAFVESLRVAQQLHQSTPANNEYLFELGQAEFWVGYVAWERKDLTAAYASMQRYLDYSRQLVARDARNPAYRLEVGYAFGNLGSIARERGQTRQAIEHFEAALAICQQHLQASPNDANVLFWLADVRSWIGSAQLDLAQLQNSEQTYRAAMEAVSGLHRQGDNPRGSERYADLAIMLADVHLRQGEIEQAASLVDESRSVLTRLVQHDPGNTLWRQNILYRTYYRASLLAATGWPAETDQLLQEAVAGYTELTASEPTRSRNWELLGLMRALQARRELSRGNTARALEFALDAKARMGRAAAGDDETPSISSSAAQIDEALGHALRAAGHNEEALSAWSQALSRLQTQPAGDLQMLAIRRQLALDLGREAEAQRLAAVLNTAGYHDPRFQPAAQSFTASAKKDAGARPVAVAQDR